MNPLKKKIPAGGYLFRENDRSRELYLIQSGTIRVFRSCGGREIELATMGPGSVLGEMALIDTKPRSASAVAQTNCLVFIIDAATFDSKTRSVPAWFLTMISMISDKVRNANKRLNKAIEEKAGVSIVLTLMHLFSRYGSGNPPAIDLGLAQNRLSHLLSLSSRHVTDVLYFLQTHDLITIREKSILCADADRMNKYCAFLRKHVRKSYQNVPHLTKNSREFLAAAARVAPAIMEMESGEVPLGYADITAEMARTLSVGDSESLLHMLENQKLCRIVGGKKSNIREEGSTDVVLYINCSLWQHYSLYAHYAHKIPTV
jgi:CRP/FNR family cyclic AMP-dependent transcriptional regulator